MRAACPTYLRLIQKENVEARKEPLALGQRQQPLGLCNVLVVDSWKKAARQVTRAAHVGRCASSISMNAVTACAPRLLPGLARTCRRWAAL